MHQRQRIRQAAIAQLVGRTIAEERVSPRRAPWRAKDLPAIGVYTLSEQVDRDHAETTAPRELKRSLLLTIEAAIRVEGDIYDALDAFALAIERAIHADETLGGTASDTVLVESRIDDDEDDRGVGAIQLTFGVTYYTHAPEAADVDLASFRTADVRTNLAAEQPVGDETQDRVTLEGA